MYSFQIWAGFRDDFRGIELLKVKLFARPGLSSCRYSLNNFLHSAVESCVTQIMEWKGDLELAEDPNKTIE